MLADQIPLHKHGFKWIYDLNTDFQAGKEITSATQFAEIPTFVSKGSRWQLHEGFDVFSARVMLGESNVLQLIRRQLADVENWGRIPTKTCKTKETRYSGYHRFGQQLQHIATAREKLIECDSY